MEDISRSLFHDPHPCQLLLRLSIILRYRFLGSLTNPIRVISDVVEGMTFKSASAQTLAEMH